MYNVKDVANFVIFLANEKIDKDFNTSEGITHLKLQKILYFAQATYLACLNTKLFTEKILAYKYWPIVEEIFVQYKHTNTPLAFDKKVNFNIIKDKDKKNLKDIREYFGKYSAFQLVEMTHAHDPRKNTKPSNEISVSSMKSFYTWKISLS